MRRIGILLLLLLPILAFANIEAHRFESKGQEDLYRVLIAELRCLVCQNQNLADSNAELAQDLRRQTYEMVTRGSSKEEIITYMVQRYGDFVLYRPPFRSSTVLLWVGPFLIFAIGVGVLVTFIRRRNRQPVEQLSSEDHARAQSLLDNNKT